jgi:hypothetical protein
MTMTAHSTGREKSIRIATILSQFAETMIAEVARLDGNYFIAIFS